MASKSLGPKGTVKLTVSTEKTSHARYETRIAFPCGPHIAGAATPIYGDWVAGR